MVNHGQFKSIALAHDSFTQLGGAERVIEVLHEMFPDAPIYSLVLDRSLRQKYQNWDIRTTWLQYFYNLIPKLQYWLFLIPWTVSSIKIVDANVVLSSSSGFVKNIRLPKNCIHINYCHTPTRFLWSEPEYTKQEVPFILRPLVKVLLFWMKKWDYNGAQKVNHFIANSKEVQNRIKEFYHRDSQVVYPFVNSQFWRPTRPKDDYFLIAGRLQAHKKNEFIVEIFNELGLPLRVAGTGRQEKFLKSIAKPNIKFLGRISDEQLRDKYSGALGLIFPQVEDFGLVPLEAAACGTATLAYNKGGSLETIVPGITGELFPDYNKGKIKDMIVHWDANKYHKDALIAQAEKFSREKFKKQITDFISQFLISY